MATELAKAYVQIIPSAKGIKGKLDNALGSDIDSYGKSSGQSMGANLISAFKGAVTAAAIGKFIASSINEGSELQQSLGGVETLFKDNADTIKQYANEAYKTVGISSNEYMQQVTSFSASLLQSLGGDTAAAAESANMALSDMADNWNKFGTAPQDVQNAYQGFAKQNYTMLDNLKLGYGGTKTEMERLLADAQKFSGIQYDISSLDDVYSAIHVIQEQMDITGTTALEASETIAGSMASMKAAFSNVLGNLALGEDITPSLTALIDATSTFLIGNLLPAVWNIVKAIPAVLVTIIKAGIPKVVEAAMQIITSLTEFFSTTLPNMSIIGSDILLNIIDGITSSLPSILNKGLEAILNFVNGFLSGYPILLETVWGTVAKIIPSIASAIPMILQAGADLILGLIQGLVSSAPQILTSIAIILAQLLQAIGSSMPQLLQSGIEIIANLIAGLIRAIPQIVSAIPQIVKSIIVTFASVDWASIGLNIIKGIISGILNAAGTLVSALLDVAKSAFNAVLDFFDINSPSGLMKNEVGKFIPLGIAKGITDNQNSIKSAMSDITDTTLKSLNSLLSYNASQTRLSAPSQTASSEPFVLEQNIYAQKQTPVEIAATTRAYFQNARWALA